MPDRFCKHLEDYAVQYVATEAAYDQCVNLVDRIVEKGPANGLADQLLSAVQEWETSTVALRETFSQLLTEGRIKKPRKKNLKARCRTCQRLVPRLEFPEWEIGAEGEVTFRGDRLPQPEPVGVPG